MLGFGEVVIILIIALVVAQVLAVAYLASRFIE